MVILQTMTPGLWPVERQKCTALVIEESTSWGRRIMMHDDINSLWLLAGSIYTYKLGWMQKVGNCYNWIGDGTKSKTEQVLENKRDDDISGSMSREYWDKCECEWLRYGIERDGIVYMQKRKKIMQHERK